MSHPRNPGETFMIGRLSALLPAVLFCWFAMQVPLLAAGGWRSVYMEWAPGLGVNLSFLLDGLSGLYALIITGVGTLVLVYADGYMAGHPHIRRFYLYLHAFLLSMLGLVLSDNFMVLFVFWELTTAFSFLLIGFDHESEASRNSARQALLVTGGGGLLLLVGILLVGHVCGSYELSKITKSGDILRGNKLYLPILVCVFAGAFTKSAQFPFHFWLPNAMTAPTPISAFLHSATMVKAGLYLLTRMHPILGGTQIWMTTLVLIGAGTALWGSVLALGCTDLKKILAYTTIMALGIITMFLGGQTTPALTAATTFLLVHALYKSALFMVAGSIDHETGTRDIRKIGGMWRSMPFTAAAALMAAMSMAGFPLFLGFIGKEIMYKGALTEDVFPELATTAAFAANAMMTAAAATLVLRPFWGKPGDVRPAGETPRRMWIAPLLISGVGLGFGMIPDHVAHWLIEPAVLSFHATTEDIQLKLFHGINEPLLLSILTLSLGGVIYWMRRKIRNTVNLALTRLPLSMAGVYDRGLLAITRLAEAQTRVLQNGSLFRYLIVIIGSIVMGVGWALTTSGSIRVTPQSFDLNPHEGILWLVMLGAIAAVVRARSSLTAICAMGVIGAGIALIFLGYGAPDVALTQLLVETLTLIIAAIVLLRLPRIPRQDRLDKSRRGLRWLTALGSGLLVTGLLLSVNIYEPDRSITAYYEASSFVKAHGRNIVNVILVDFRSLDTLGEIMVVAAAAIGGVSLIRKGRSER